jgi:hypothetical protein
MPRTRWGKRENKTVSFYKDVVSDLASKGISIPLEDVKILTQTLIKHIINNLPDNGKAIGIAGNVLLYRIDKNHIKIRYNEGILKEHRRFSITDMISIKYMDELFAPLIEIEKEFKNGGN